MGLALPPPGPDEPVLRFQQTIKRIGTCYKFSLQLPTPSQTLKISLEREYRSFNTSFDDNVGSTDINTFDENRTQQNNNDMMDLDNQIDLGSSNNAEPNKIPKKYWKKMSMPVVSRDPLIPSMVVQHKVNIVISSSSLCALVALQASADIEVELPIRVVEIKDNDTILKTVYIDKPLLEKRITPRQRNQAFYDIALESMAFDLGVDVNEVFNNSVGNVHNNLVFRSSLAPKKVGDLSKEDISVSSNVSNDLRNNDTSKNGDVSEITTLRGTAEKSEGTRKKCDQVEEDESQTNINNYSDPDELINPTCQATFSNDQLRSGNLIYNLWNFGDMNILVRCKAHAYIRESNNDNRNRIIGVKTKLEYQLDLGMEEITNLERARWWIYTYIRNNAHLILGHINVLTNELVDIQRMRMADIIPDGNWPRPHSKLLHHVLKKLQGLPTGVYLFSHEKGDPHATVYKSADPLSLTSQDRYSTELCDQPSTILPEVATHFYDLHRARSQPPHFDLKTIPFVQIKWSGPQNQVPYTFPIRTPEKKLIYCFDFMRFGKCDKTDCIYPHLTKEQCELSGIKTSHCFVFADTGKCENRNCHYAHIPKDQIEGFKTNVSSKKPKKKRSKNKKCEVVFHEEPTNPLDLDDKNMVESSGTSLAPDFETLLRRFSS